VNGGGAVITVGQNGLLNILSCATAGCACFGASPQIAEYIPPAPANAQPNGVVLLAGATLQFNAVGSASFGALVIADVGWSFAVGSTIVAQLTPQLPTTATSIPLMYYKQAGVSCSLPSVLTTVPTLAPRTVSSHCQTVTQTINGVAGPYFVLYLDLGPAVAPSGTSETTSFQFNSTAVYSLTLNKVCGVYGVTNFVADVVASSLTGRGPTTASQIIILGSQCGSVIIQFRCSSSQSPQDADNLCATIVNDAQLPGTQLNARVQGIQGGQFTSSNNNSNTALYALFALLAIPLICVIGICLLVKAKQREADNQYMQDTATFSNVAASPQPLGAPGYYPAETNTGMDPYMHKPY